MADIDSRVKHLSERVRSMADAGVPEPIAAPGDDALGELERQVNRLIRSSNAHLQERLLFAVGPVVVFRWQNREGWPVEYVSPNIEALTGYPVDEFASGSRPYATLIHEDDLGRVVEEVTSNSQSNVSWFVHRPYRMLRADGKALWVADYTVILRDEAGQATHFFGYILDISDQMEQLSVLRTQERVIERLGSPILQVGHGVLAVPLLGNLDGDRASRMTDELLLAVNKNATRTAILDLTGLQDIDTATIEHLLRTSRAVGLLGCRCLLSGISPTVATVIVQLGLETQTLTTVATLQDALELALNQ
jgi:anti-anti-sigma factor